MLHKTFEILSLNLSLLMLFFCLFSPKDDMERQPHLQGGSFLHMC